MTATLYSLRLSHPAHAVQAMLERKGIEHRVRDLPAGFHPLLVRAAGFRGGTVPALRIDGRRIQGSREIAAALDGIRADPPLFPAGAAARRAVAEAEEWGEQVLQPVPRRLIRWGVRNSLAMRRWLARDIERMPAAALLARAGIGQAAYFARSSGATGDAVRADLERLQELLAHVERLADAGAIGGPAPNAADFQIAATVRVLAAFEDLAPAVAPTPAAALAAGLLPAFAHRVPAFLPADWLPRA